MINLLSSDQAMNTSFDPLDLVNTYGAFGSVDRERYEVILEGTRDETPGDDAHWEEYELPCMPGDVRRRPCLVTPYHYRLDWQMWFVGQRRGARRVDRGRAVARAPRVAAARGRRVAQAASSRATRSRAQPPRWIRAGIWRYRFSTSRAGGAWWERERVGEYLPPVSQDDPGLREYVRAYGWARGPR